MAVTNSLMAAAVINLVSFNNVFGNAWFIGGVN